MILTTYLTDNFWPFSVYQLSSVNVMSANVFDFNDEDLAHQCSRYLPNVDKIACADAIDAFRFLKNKVAH